jgi:hypothetical protein
MAQTRRNVGWPIFIVGIVVAANLQIDREAIAADTGERDVIIQTEHGPVKGKIVRPESSKEKPGDIGKRAHTPLEVVIPDKPIEPPRPGRGN